VRSKRTEKKILTKAALCRAGRLKKREGEIDIPFFRSFKGGKEGGGVPIVLNGSCGAQGTEKGCFLFFGRKRRGKTPYSPGGGFIRSVRKGGYTLIGEGGGKEGEKKFR